MKTNLDDFFEKSRNLDLKQRVEGLLVQQPIDFAAAIEKAKEITLQEAAVKPPNYKARNFMAENMYGNMIGVLKDNYPDLIKEDQYHRPYVQLAPDVRVYLKKLNEKYLPSNITTEHVKDMNAQLLFDEEEQINVVYAGFVLAENDWTLDLKGVFISYINRVFAKQAAWVIDLKEEQFLKSMPIVSYMDTQPVQEENLVSVPKKQDGADKASNQ